MVNRQMNGQVFIEKNDRRAFNFCLTSYFYYAYHRFAQVPLMHAVKEPLGPPKRDF